MNREVLRRQGVLYPRTGVLEPNGNAQHHLAFALMERYPDWIAQRDRKDAEALYGQFYEEVGGSSCGTVVVSSEAFSSLTSGTIGELRDRLNPLGLHLEIVCFLRRPDLWVESWYSQVVKDFPFSTNSFEDFLASFKPRIYTSLRDYREAFGSGNVMLVNYEDQLGNGISTYFINKLHLSETSLEERANASPSRQCIEVLRYLNANLNLNINERRRLNLGIVDLMKEGVKACYFSDFAQRLEYLERCQVLVQEVSSDLYLEFLEALIRDGDAVANAGSEPNCLR